MKNKQKGFVSILLAIIILAVIGGGVYFYLKQKSEVKITDTTDVQGTSTIAITTDVKSVNKTTLPDSEFLKTFIKDDPDSKIVARGDINMDGYEDVIVQEVHCGASCSIGLWVVLNDRNITANLLKDKNYPDTFSPAYVASSAAKSNVTNVVIKDGIIYLTGTGLMCTDGVVSESNTCTEEKWKINKTVTYKFDGKDIVQLGVNVSEELKTESFKKQPIRILSIKDLGNGVWSMEADLLTRNPAWIPGGNALLYINQNSKIRTLTISKDTKVNGCVDMDLPTNPGELISVIKKALSAKDSDYIQTVDIEGSKITSAYGQCAG